MALRIFANQSALWISIYVKVKHQRPSSRAVAEGDVRLLASLKTLLLLYMIISIWTIKVFNDLNKKHKSRVILHQNKCESWGGGGFFYSKKCMGEQCSLNIMFQAKIDVLPFSIHSFIDILFKITWQPGRSRRILKVDNYYANKVKCQIPKI